MDKLNFLIFFSIIIFIDFLLATSLLTQFAHAAEKMERNQTIAVVEFAVRGSDLDPQAGAIIADSITSVIASLGHFAIKDRISLSATAKIAKNSQLGSIGPIDSETAMRLGKLYGVHGIVTGTISKLGDRVRVTARLIDTGTGIVLRSSEIQDRDIDAVQVKLDELAMSITTMPVSPASSLRALTVKTEPPNAVVRLLDLDQPYQPGIRLPAGAYAIEISHPGYVNQKASAKIADNDVTLLITLKRDLYALTVEVEPPESRIRILNIPKPYQAGMKLEAGVYQLEVSCPGYQTQNNTIAITDANVSVVLKLEPKTDSPAVPVRPPSSQTLEANRAVPPSAKKQSPGSSRSAKANPRTNKPVTKGAGNRTNRPHEKGAGDGNRTNRPNQPTRQSGAFKRALRQFRDDFKEAFR
jgi:TolB-like protein